jgi:hypothetical protein
VQDRLRELLDGKVVAATDKVAELVAFTAELKRASARLGPHTPDGPCDETCGCTADQEAGAAPAVPLTSHPVPATETVDVAGAAPIACTLAPDRVGDRLTDWHTALAPAVAREAIANGVRVRFSSAVDVASLATLAAAEQDCCRFFTFAITIAAGGVTLDVTGPDEARPVIEALFGASIESPDR